MDLVTVTDVRTPSSRAELSFAPGERPMGGGTWLYSEAQPGLTGLVDLTSLGWSPLDETPDGVTVSATCTIAELTRLRARPEWAAAPLIRQCAESLLASFKIWNVATVGATCTIAELTRLRARPEWAAAPLIRQCAESLLASFKIWNVATVGGNVALGLPAGAMTSLMSTLDATAVVWTTDGGERRTPVAEFVTGVRESALAPGEVLRALEIPTASLESQTAFRRIALSPLGRSGTLVTGRLAEAGEFVVTVTAGTIRPVQLRFDEVPSERALSAALDGVDEWYDDPHGAPDWRRATSTGFAEEIRRELGGSW